MEQKVIDWTVDINKVDWKLNIDNTYTDGRIALTMRYLAFNLLLDINDKLKIKFTDKQIATLVNTVYKNARNIARLGINGGYWKFDEELDETLSAMKTLIDFYKENKLSDNPNIYFDSLSNFLEENIARELVSTFSMYLKAITDAKCVVKDSSILDEERHNKLISLFTGVIGDLVNPKIFVYSYLDETNELEDTMEAFDSACAIVSGEKVTYDSVTLDLVRRRTPELINFVKNRTNPAKVDPKMIKELRIAYRTRNN